MKLGQIIKLLVSSKPDYTLFGQTISEVGRQLGDPKNDALHEEMGRNYRLILSKLTQDGCNFVLILAALVNDAMKELDELQEKRKEIN